MHKRILALICTAVLMSNLVSIENWSMITRAEEQEEQTEAADPKKKRKVPAGVCLLTRQDLCWICAAS